jgi:hypothetical protein
MQNQINIDSQNIQQVGQDHNNQSVQIPEKPKTNHLFLGTIILVCFLVFGVGGYYLGRSELRKTQPTEILPTSTATTGASPVVAPTNKQDGNLKTYKNARYGLSFEYPKNYVITTNSNCSSLTNNQAGCLLSLTLDPTNSDYPPKAYFWLLQGINSVNILGQVSNINFNLRKKAWVLNNTTSSAEVISIWDHTKSGQEIIKFSNEGSHGSSYYYLIPNYKNDKVAIFSVPQSYRLRCDNFIDNKSKETDCNNFYKSVINQYNRGELTPDTWLPENYLNYIYSEAENIVKSYAETAK